MVSSSSGVPLLVRRGDDRGLCSPVRRWKIEDFASKADVLVDRLQEPGLSLSEVKCSTALPRTHFAIRSRIGGVVHIVAAAGLGSLDTSGRGAYTCTMSCLVEIGVCCGSS
jgi:hypothetical protein